MRKKLIKVLLVLSLIICVKAQNLLAIDFAGKEDEYNELCSGAESEKNEETCKAYREYLREKKKNFDEKLSEINEQIKNLESDIEAAINSARKYQIEIDKLQKEIDELNVKIDELNKGIKVLQDDINKKQNEIDTIRKKVLDRMVAMQKHMHFNPFLDFLMGAKNFEDLIARSNGVRAVMSFDSNTNKKLVELVKKLNEDKEKLEKSKKILDESKQEKVAKEEDLIIQKTYFDMLKDELLKKQEDLRSSSNQIVENLASVKASINKVGGMPSADGWGQVVDGDWFISAGTWYYDTGGRHLGLDMAANVGTPIVSPGNGVVIKTYDGCPTYGYLGNGCGVLGGLGNQVRLVLSVNNKLYGVTIGHMQEGSVVESGKVVSTGDYLGKVGSSGSSTGPHAHVEVVYLGDESDWKDGDGSPIDNYVAQWDGHLSFGTDRYSGTFLDYACENKASAPCRLRPETIWGQ